MLVELLPPSIDTLTFAVLLAVAATAGFIDAIAGGGGLLTIPALLTAGLPPHLALGTNKLAASFGSATASLTFYRRGFFNPIFWWQAALFTFIGAILGTLMADWLDATWLDRLLPIIVCLTALYVLLQKKQPKQQELPPLAPGRPLYQRLQGLSIGFYDGVAGPGTGSFWVVSSMGLYKLSMLYASGVARSMNFISNIVSLAVFLLLGHVHLFLGFSLGVAIMTGSYLGARLAIHFGSPFIRPLFISVVLIISARLVWQAWFS